MSENSLKYIPLSQIRENPVALRRVNKKREGYIELVDSIRQNGIFNPIVVREAKSPNGETIYGLVDGLHRFTAAQDAGLTEVPAHVKSMEEAGVLEAQIMANIHKVETRPSEYSEQLTRILTQNPLLTLNELATRLAKSPAWLTDRLSLIKLDPEIKKLVDEGTINLTNAYSLAKLPLEEQPNFVDRAMTQSPQEFVPTAAARVKEIKNLLKAGRDPSKGQEFVAVAHLRKLGELKEEATNCKVGPLLLNKFNVQTPLEAWKLATQWVLHLDPESIELAKIEDQKRKAELEEQKKKRQMERDEQKAKLAAAAAAQVQMS